MFEWAAMTKQRRLPVGETDIYCDVCIIILCVQTICFIPLLLYAMKYVNDVLCKSVDQV